jgi:hypothetical protein
MAEVKRVWLLTQCGLPVDLATEIVRRADREKKAADLIRARFKAFLQYHFLYVADDSPDDGSPREAVWLAKELYSAYCGWSRPVYLRFHPEPMYQSSYWRRRGMRYLLNELKVQMGRI